MLNTEGWTELRELLAFPACDVDNLDAEACAALEECEAEACAPVDELEALSAGMTRMCRFGIGVAPDRTGS